jgi:hypothetical protein
VLNAARLQHDVDGRIAPLASWSTNQCAPDGSHDQLLEFSGDSYVIYSGTVPVRLCDRWVKLGRAPVAVPVPGEGPPLDAAPRCTISVGAWQRCSPFPELWMTDLRVRMPDVDFSVLDALEQVCPWQAPVGPMAGAGAGAGGGAGSAPARALPPIRVERGVVTFPEQHAWDVLLSMGCFELSVGST